MEELYYFYLVVCLLLSYMLAQLLPRRFKVTLYLNFILFFLIAASLFILGVVAIFVLFLVLDRLKPVKKEVSLFATSEIPDYQHSPNPKSVIYGEGSGPSILQNMTFSVKDKEKMIVAINQFHTAKVNELNKLLLQNTTDEVRLYAHSLIEKQERALFKLLTYFNNLLSKEKDVVQKAILHKHIAELLWEQVYSALVNEDGLKGVFENIKYHAQQAFSILQQDTSIPLLMVLISLREGEIDAAKNWLEVAENNEASYYRILLLKAEIAFREKNFSEVRNLSGQLKDKAIVGADSIINFWSRA